MNSDNGRHRAVSLLSIIPVLTVVTGSFVEFSVEEVGRLLGRVGPCGAMRLKLTLEEPWALTTVQ